MFRIGRVVLDLRRLSESRSVSLPDTGKLIQKHSGSFSRVTDSQVERTGRLELQSVHAGLRRGQKPFETAELVSQLVDLDKGSLAFVYYKRAMNGRILSANGVSA